jgi:hypothetical protein
MPLFSANRPKFLNKIRIKQRLAAAKGDAAAGREEVQLVQSNPVEKLPGAHVRSLCFRGEGKGV